MSSLNIVTQIVDNKAIVTLVGKIDEDAVFEDLKKIEVKEYHFDFEQVTLINSPGIREWINFLDTIKDTKVHYNKCQQIIIEQINMIHGFLREGAIIDSFYAPYYCETCDHEKKVLLFTKDITEAKPPAIKHEKCDKEMEFDAIEDQYFNFLKK